MQNVGSRFVHLFNDASAQQAYEAIKLEYEQYAKAQKETWESKLSAVREPGTSVEKYVSDVHDAWLSLKPLASNILTEEMVVEKLIRNCNDRIVKNSLLASLDTTKFTIATLKPKLIGMIGNRAVIGDHHSDLMNQVKLAYALYSHNPAAAQLLLNDCISPFLPCKQVEHFVQAPRIDASDCLVMKVNEKHSQSPLTGKRYLPSTMTHSIKCSINCVDPLSVPDPHVKLVADTRTLKTWTHAQYKRTPFGTYADITLSKTDNSCKCFRCCFLIPIQRSTAWDLLANTADNVQARSLQTRPLAISTPTTSYTIGYAVIIIIMFSHKFWCLKSTRS